MTQTNVFKGILELVTEWSDNVRSAERFDRNGERMGAAESFEAFVIASCAAENVAARDVQLLADIVRVREGEPGAGKRCLQYLEEALDMAWSCDADYSDSKQEVRESIEAQRMLRTIFEITPIPETAEEHVLGAVPEVSVPPSEGPTRDE